MINGSFKESVEGMGEALPLDASQKDNNNYERRMKEVMLLIRLNLVELQLSHMKNCESPTEVWKILCDYV